MGQVLHMGRVPQRQLCVLGLWLCLHIRDELVAGAFVRLPEQEQQILILHYVATMADTNIGRLMGMSRSAVQRHRTKA